ncbi:alanine:cation symporter family protein [Halosquirtibacter xylanolyticus]|uniref:alanine/glycine:cation symporter family protein n=1 Tax=Halosquirtibacter xylanolyticus TaxID=3374599 RepID=UPI003748B363|nr:alanine:cation symporter family protein [Prolixibacteraceae bacterium]
MFDTIEKMISQFDGFITLYLLIPVLLLAGLYFTFKTKFVQFTNFREMFRLLTEGNNEKGGISSFQAFTISLASRVGTGNLAGVALAVAAGGPGAVFWMWLIALLGSASAFIESTLAQVYKVEDKEAGAFKGGPAYYMEQALKNRKLGIAFAILITICYGFVFNAVQSDTISAAFNKSFSTNPEIMGIILVILTGAIIFGGVKRIAKATNAIVPIMAISYIMVALYIIITNISLIPHLFKTILDGAFGINQAAAGALGAAVTQGIKRGLFSNEAGMGSAPNAAAAATVSHPAKQGLIQALGVFTDTLVICSSTAFMILISGVHTSSSNDGIQLTQEAMITMVGPWGSIFIAVCIFLFAFSSIIGNYYYGESNIKFITEKKKYLQLYRVLVLGMVIFGALASSSLVWNLADIFMVFMALLNLFAIIQLAPIAIRVLKNYTQQRKKGKNPVFKAKDVGLDNETQCWN